MTEQTIQPETSGNTIVINTPTESIEVTRNSRGFNWTIKVIGIYLKRLQELTNELNKLYPL